MTAWQVMLPGTGWLELPVDRRPDDDARGWARQAAVELLPAGSADGLAEVLAEELSVHIRYTTRLDAVLAAVLIPEPEAGVLAVLVARQLPYVDIDELERTLAAPTPGELRPPDVRRLRLPAGPACRVRRLIAVPESSDEQVLTESVIHVVVDADEDQAIELRLEWLAVAVGDELSELADELANRFVLLDT
jgi:hypothetical protein